MKPNITEIIGQHVNLKKNGHNHFGLCPFHVEKTPSFSVSTSKQKFKCFGCGIGGDVIDFIQKYFNLTFPEAKRHLQMEPDKKSREQIAREKVQAELVADFRDWVAKYSTDIGRQIRNAHIWLSRATPEEIEQFGSIYHGLTMWEHRLDVIINGTDVDRFKLYQEIR